MEWNGMEWLFIIAPQLHERDFLHDWTKALKTADKIKT